MALFIDSVCAADEPCRGRSETILTVFASPPASVPVPPASPSSSPPHPAAMKAKAPTNRSRTAKSVLLLTPPPQSPDLPLSPSARPSRGRKLSPGWAAAFGEAIITRPHPSSKPLPISCPCDEARRSGGTGRRAGLKIQWGQAPRGFDPRLRHHVSY